MAVNIDDWTSTVFICDNLPFLKAIPSESIDLVCIDPPFGKKQTFVGTLVQPLSKEELRIEQELMRSWGVTDPDSAYEAGLEWPDQEGKTAKFEEIWNFSRHIYAGWIEQLELLNPGLDFLIKATRYTQDDGIAAYIAFMAERMFQVKRILKPTGSVYLHCDHAANAYLRQMMDAVFGRTNFCNEIVWRKYSGRKNNATTKFSTQQETILFYRKSRFAEFNVLYEPISDEEVRKKYKFKDENGRRYREAWGRRYQLTGENRRIYLEDQPGAAVGSLWVEDGIQLNTSSAERVGYPTQKPQALARRIIEASCPEGGVVLDCFAGCAYVPVAAQRAGRRWIACDMSPRAWTVIRRQFHKQPDLGIRTEGEIPPDPEHPDLYAELQMLGKVIRVRGPYDLPEPVESEAQAVMQGVIHRANPKYRTQPEETKDQIWDAFVAEWGTACWYCGQPQYNSRRVLQLDHVEPNQRDGSNDDCWNRALACIDCNGDKSDKLTPEQTIDLALARGRIPTPARAAEQKEAFQRRMAWAAERWEREIKPHSLIAD